MSSGESPEKPPDEEEKPPVSPPDAAPNQAVESQSSQPPPQPDNSNEEETEKARSGRASPVPPTSPSPTVRSGKASPPSTSPDPTVRSGRASPGSESSPISVLVSSKHKKGKRHSVAASGDHSKKHPAKKHAVHEERRIAGETGSYNLHSIAVHSELANLTSTLLAPKGSKRAHETAKHVKKDTLRSVSPHFKTSPLPKIHSTVQAPRFLSHGPENGKEEVHAHTAMFVSRSPIAFPPPKTSSTSDGWDDYESINELRRKIHSASSTILALHKRLEGEIANGVQMQRFLAERKSEINALKGRVAELEGEMADHQKDRGVMEKRYAAIRDQLAMSIALQNKDSQTQNAESAAASAQLKVVRIERDKLSKKLQAYEDEIAVLKDSRLQKQRDVEVQTTDKRTVLRSWMWFVSLRMLASGGFGEEDREEKECQTDMMMADVRRLERTVQHVTATGTKEIQDSLDAADRKSVV